MLHIIFFGKLKQHDLFHLDRQSYTTKKIGLNIGFPANQLANRQASLASLARAKASCATVDGRNPANQLRLAVYPMILRVLYIPGGAGFLPSTVLDWLSWGDVSEHLDG